ncbi:hypothetical protein OAG24_00300 [bacterium]|nr:hypothetical protein [bacterium]
MLSQNFRNVMDGILFPYIELQNIEEIAKQNPLYVKFLHDHVSPLFYDLIDNKIKCDFPEEKVKCKSACKLTFDFPTIKTVLNHLEKNSPVISVNLTFSTRTEKFTVAQSKNAITTILNVATRHNFATEFVIKNGVITNVIFEIKNDNFIPTYPQENEIKYHPLESDKILSDFDTQMELSGIDFEKIMDSDTELQPHDQVEILDQKIDLFMDIDEHLAWLGE